MNQLLISVRNAEEAAIASKFSIGIMDFKNPHRGALGAVETSEMHRMIEVLPPHVVKSAALGELRDWLEEPRIGKRVRDDLNGLQYAKVGLAGMGSNSNWQQHWLEFFRVLPPSVIPVGVAYADADCCDAPEIEDVLGFISAQPNAALLIDSFEKRHGSTLEMLGIKRIRRVVKQARSAGVKIVIAGSVQEHQLPILVDCLPDYIGIRGAVCLQGREVLDPAKLNRVVSVVAELVQGLKKTQAV